MSITKERRLEKKIAGICVRDCCKNPQRETSLTCLECYQEESAFKARWKKTERGKAAHAANNKRYRAARRRRGTCMGCGRRMPLRRRTKNSCDPCADAIVAHRRAMDGRVVTRRCRVCGEIGHNRRWHRWEAVMKKIIGTERPPMPDAFALPIEHYATARPEL